MNPRLWVGLGVLVLGLAGAGIALLASEEEERLPPPQVEGSVSVEVLNGCGIDGAAGRVANLLQRAGYRVERVADADHYHYREDVVIVRSGRLENGRILGRLLEADAVVEQRRSESPVHLTVVVGRPHALTNLN